MPQPSITEIPEHELVALLYKNLQAFQHVALPPQTPWPAHISLLVTPQALEVDSKAFGDADALIVPYGQPHFARAIEFKRILMPAHTFATLRPNKLRELAKGVKQANCLSKTGFAYVWFSILVVVDSRELTRPTGGYMAASLQLMEAVYRALPLKDLDDAVGAVVYELTQCFDAPIGQSGMLGGHLVRMASAKQQPQPLTNGIMRLVSRSSSLGKASTSGLPPSGSAE